jgi:glycosyltransferase involved in cell wall biosynthesis
MTGSFINISVFTPTYNRVVLLERLYISLINQTNYNFEWIIVDDGSSDDTLDKVNKWIAENKIKITYYKQENRGKHTAINKGVSLAKNLLFFIVDSDDYLLPCNVVSLRKSLEIIFLFPEKVLFLGSIKGVIQLPKTRLIIE